MSSRFIRYNRTVKGKYRNLKRAAKNRAQGFNVNLEEFLTLQAAPCIYCGDNLPKSGHGVDRIDPSKGYKRGNIQPCCFVCNRAKGDLTHMQFLKHLRKIRDNGWD